jgi:hypothetical protein
MKKIITIMSFTSDLRHVYSVIQEAAMDASDQLGEQLKISRTDEFSPSTKSVIQTVLSNLDEADLVIADLSHSKSSELYELGVAHGREKPVILVGQRMETSIFDITSIYTLIYDSSRIETSFKQKLVKQIVEAIKSPEKFSHPFYRQESEENLKPTVFVSYSHADARSLTRLQIHLKPLEKENQIELWDDTRILAGAKWKEEIEAALERAAIAVLLISADFLASDFVVDNELPPLLQAAEEKGTTILPVILKPCRFARDKNLSRFQAINDPRKPLLSMRDAEQEEMYAKLAERIENEINASV